jgi:hypothetical protein
MRSIERVFVLTDISRQRPQAFVYVTNGTQHHPTMTVMVMNPEALRALGFSW